MVTTPQWLMMNLESGALAVVPALLLALVFMALGLVYGWGWRALWLLPIGPLLVAMAWAAWGFGLPTAPNPKSADALRVAHANTLMYLDRPAAPKAAFAAQSGAEVVSLLEVNEGLREALQSISGTYPHQVHSGGNLPMMLLAHHPITKAQSWGPRMVLYHIAKPGQAFYVLQVHPQSPYSPAGMALRAENLAKLAEILPILPRPLIVLGDMNTTPWDKAATPIRAALTQAGGWKAYLPTFPSMMPVTPIDALYYSSAFKGAALQHIRVPGSDHLGLVIDLVISVQ